VSVSDEEISRRHEEIFGKQLNADRQSGLAALLETLDQANDQAVAGLAPGSEPMGHRAILRSPGHGE
jgi:hypothetical protein|tara:strand:- start:427 stop:627 length:201 start_codon:yes stop_codon:yes gene_type:complete